MTEKKGCVWLIGAGCGGVDLMTVRGLRLLRQCDVVVYDDLIDSALLAEAPREARRVYMGKRRGKHSASQEEISRRLVEEALAGRRVARLKGGDPFVFGRGGEEAQALRAAGVPYEEVPGISSAIAIPAAAGIPVTHRHLSRSVHIITGHTAANGLPEDMDHLAALRGTLVFLMGLSHLEQIAESLLAAGKSPDTPAAVLSGGNAAHPAAVRASLGTIARRAREADVRPPAVIVVGDVAELDLSGTVERPLDGVRVGLTGTDAMAARLRAALEPLGADIRRVERAVVEALPIEEEGLFRDRRWLAFTSVNGVETFFRFLRRERVDLRRMAGCKFAVIGAATGAALERHGILPELCPQAYTGAALAAALTEHICPGEDVVLLRAEEGTPLLPSLLARQGIPVRDVPIYKVRSDREAAEAAKPVLETLDYLVFSSAGGVGRYFALHGAVPAGGTVCVCIGGVTAKALGTWYEEPFLTAESISAEGIAETIVRHRTRRAHGTGAFPPSQREVMIKKESEDAK